MYVRSTSALARFSHAGRTLAGRFRARRREVAYAWVAAWERAEAGLSAIDITRAEDRISALNEAADAEEQQRLAAFHGEIHERHKKARARTPGDARPGKRPADAQVPRPVHAPGQFQERHLVDPTELRPVFTDSSIVPQNDRSRSDASGSRTSSSSGRPSLSRPSSSSAVPQQRSGVKMFTPQEQEGAALALVRAALARDSEELRDLRAQRGVGADSVDELNRFYEVKSFLGAEEDSVSLTPHEFERAATERNFFLVVVSGLQRGAGIPATVRIILDPLRKLSVRTSESVTLTGVRGCGSLQIPFEQAE